MRLPGQLRIAKVGGAVLTTVTEKVELDVPVDAALFAKPAKAAPKSTPAGGKDDKQSPPRK